MAQDQTNAALQARKDSIMAELTKTEKQVRLLSRPCPAEGTVRASTAWCPLQLYDAESNYLGAEYSVNRNVIKVRPTLPACEVKL